MMMMMMTRRRRIETRRSERGEIVHCLFNLFIIIFKDVSSTAKEYKLK
jgi:hypothetical protein